MTIYVNHIIYKTIHTDGRYYIGRHSTTNLDDGYLGSGNWVNAIKDKESLRREILDSAASLEELKSLEIKYLEEHYEHPLNMNFTKSAEGITSEQARELSNKRVREGTHNFQVNPANLGGKISRKLVQQGIHPFQTNHPNKNGKISKKLIADGIHHWQTNYVNLNPKRLADGTHNFLTNNPSYLKLTCIHCGRTICKSAHTKYHGDKCKINN